MIRLLMAGLLLCASGFGWAMAYPDKYEGVPNTFKDGDIIKAEDFNNNNLSIKKAINDIPAGATGPAGAAGADGVAAGLSCTTDQSIVYRGGAWVCSSPGVVVEWFDSAGGKVLCPDGKRVTGGGCQFVNPEECGDIVSYPESDLSGWTCMVLDNSFGGLCRVGDGYAICQ